MDSETAARSPRRQRQGYHELAAELRRRITTGALPPASRIRTKLELCREFGVSDATVQRALHVLAREGFLRSRGCAGTWVTAQPPHLSRVGLVFADPVGRSRFWMTIVQEARRLEANGPLRFPVYERCGYPMGPDLARLQEDLRTRRLAGLLLLTRADNVLPRRLAESCGVVRVSVTQPDPFADPHRIELPSCAPFVLEYLRARGHRRIALITTFSQFGPNPYQSGDLARRAAALGMEIPSRFIHPVSISEHYTACHTLELMMSLPPADRPDAVCIMDDHLVEQATLGIARAGVVPGPDRPLEVVVHANFPNPPVSHVPVTWHGYDVRGLVAAAVRMVTDALAGRPVPVDVVLPPVFGHELPYALPGAGG
jgi:hypothetical protein